MDVRVEWGKGMKKPSFERYLITLSSELCPFKLLKLKLVATKRISTENEIMRGEREQNKEQQ